MILENTKTDSERFKSFAVLEDAEQHAKSADNSIKNRLQKLQKTLTNINPGFEHASVIRYDYKISKKEFIIDDLGISNEEDRELSLFLKGAAKGRNSTEYSHNKKALLIFPLTTRNDYSIYYNCLLAIEKPDKITLSEIRFIQNMIEYYIVNYINFVKHNALANIYTYLEQISSKSNAHNTWTDLWTSVRGAFELLADAIIASTNSHSFTVRRLNPRTNKLEVFYEQHDTYGQRITGEQHLALSKFEIEKSFNCFTFAMCSKSDGFFYLPNIKRIPEEYIEMGLSQTIECRDSKSEFTAPVFFKDTKIGLLNIESPQENNFAAHSHFIMEGLNSICRATEGIMGQFDARWVGELTKSRAALHEAKQITFTELSDPGNGPLGAKRIDGLGRLHDMIELALSSDTPEKQPLDDFIRQATDHTIIKNKRVYTRIEKICGINTDENPHVVFVINECVTNLVKSNNDKNVLRITYEDQENIGFDGPALHVEQHIYDFLGAAEIEKLGLEPLDYDQRRHYGLYLSSALARTAGGWMSVHGDPLKHSYVIITFIIPLFSEETS